MSINQPELEQLVEVITQQVLSSVERGVVPLPTHCIDCDDSKCVITCPDVAEKFIAAGADRLSLTPGISNLQAPSDVARLIDHTHLKPEATRDQIHELCMEAREFEFASVCVNPFWVPFCADLLAGSPVEVCTVVGFPLGANRTETKVAETEQACRSGATEIDMVINIGALKGDELEVIADDIAAVTEAAHAKGAIVKTIIEAALLSDEEKVEACTAAKAVGADFVKTSTGFGPGGATVHDVALMRRVVGADIGVKAAGGVRNYEDAQQMVQAGATRIGASAGIAIVQGRTSEEDY